MKKILPFISLLMFSLIGQTLNATLLMPMKIGDVFTYERFGTDQNGEKTESWNNTFTAINTITAESGNVYYHLLQYNYKNQKETSDLFIRSTETAIFWYDGSSELLMFDIDKNFDDFWYFGTDKVTYKGIEQISILGIDRNAFVFKLNEESSDGNLSQDWYEYIVQGIGLVKEIDYNTTNAPKINTLVSIQSTPVPEPTAILLFGTSLAALAAFGRRRQN